MKKEKGDMLVKKHKNKKMKKKILRSLPIIILFCVYLCGYVYFSVHFLPKTIINGNRCGMKTVKEGNDLEKKRMRDYQIIMRLNNSECILMNKDVPYVRSDVRSEMKDILKKQKKFAWFLHLKDKKVFHIGKYVVNEDALKSSLNTFTFVHPEDIRQPENAKLKFNKKTQRYKIIEAVSGNKINFQKLISGVKKTAEAKKTYFDASKCYPQARVDSKSKQLLEAKKTLDAYLSCTIQYKSGTKNKKTLNGTYLFVFLVEKICTSSGIALTYGEFIGQEKYSIFLTMITFLISIPYILSFLLRMIKKFIQVVTGNKSVALIFKPVEALISINVLRYAIYILLFFTSVFTYSVNVSQSDYVFSLVKEALLEFVLLDTVIYSIITNIRDTKKNHKQQNMRRYYVPFKYDLEFVLSAITMHNLKDKEMYARIKFSVDINKILKEKKQNDVSEIDKLLAEISTNYYKIEILEQKTKVVLSRIIDLIG